MYSYVGNWSIPHPDGQQREEQHTGAKILDEAIADETALAYGDDRQC